MNMIKDLGKGDMSGILHLGGVVVLGIGIFGGSLHLVAEKADSDMVLFLTTATFAIGLSLIMFGIGSVHGAMRKLGFELETIKMLAAQAGGENREQFEKTDAGQMLRSVTSYIEMEMWVEAFTKGSELINKYPKSEEAKKLKNNIDHIKKKAQEKPTAPKPVAGPAAGRPATGKNPAPVPAAPAPAASAPAAPPK